jgi:hypothetical protein
MASSITKIDSDTSGAQLSRDENKKLYIVSGSESMLIKEQWSDSAASWLEYTNDWGNGYNKREAIAVEAVKAGNGSITGYKLAIKVSNKNGDSPAQVSWDILYVDANGKLNSGYSGSNGQWIQTSDYGVKSIAAYEKTIFNQDLNGDGDIGLNLSKLVLLDTDKHGTQLARDTEQGLYIVEVSNSGAITGTPLAVAGNFEYSNIYSADNYNVRSAIAVVAETGSNGAVSGYRIAVKNSNKWSSAAEQVSYDILSFGTDGKQVYGMAMMSNGVNNDPNVYGIKSLMAYETLFGEDFNNDGVTGFNFSKLTALSKDTTGDKLMREADTDALYIVNAAGTAAIALPNMEYSNGDANYYNKREAVAVVATKNGDVITGYKIALKNSNKWSSDSAQVTYDILSLNTEGKQVYGSNVNGMWVDSNITGVKSLKSYELMFNDDLDGDGSVGININALDVVNTDTGGARLKRDSDKALYIVNEEGNKAIELPNASNFEYGNSSMSTDYYNKREAISIEAVKDGATLTGYRLLIKRSDKNGSAPEQVSYDILALNTEGKQVYGNTVNGTWSDPNVYGVKSLMAYEILMNQDFNGDNEKGIRLNKLIETAASDTRGVVLKRDAQKGLYVVSEDGSAAFALPNSGWMEYYNGDSNNYNKREAIAIEAVKTDSVITGYKLAIKNSNKWNGNTEQVTYDVLTLDAEGKQVSGAMMSGSGASGSAGGMTSDPNAWGLKSLTSYEKTFNEDFNGDNFVGVDPSKLLAIATDTQGVVLKRDSAGALYVVFGGNVAPLELPNASMLENNNNWGNGYNKREVIAIEAIKDGSTITGFKLAVKNSNKYDTNPEQVTYDILTLNAEGRQVYGNSVNGVWTDPNVYGAKSLTSYETFFNQDFNDDQVVGIDPAKLTAVTTDTKGVMLKRDKAGALYVVSSDSTPPMELPNSSWMEYSNNWGSGSNKREAIAIETVKEAGVVSGFKLVLKNTNKYDGNPDQVTYDILSLNTEGKQVYGTGPAMMGMGGGSDTNIYGVKSLTPYEKMFGEDFNGDGFIGVDVTKLVKVPGDSVGVTLARDPEGGLYLVNAAGNDATAVGNAGWLEYSNNYNTTDYNKREAIAVEALSDGSGYKLAMKSTNKWGGNPEQVTYDILHLDTTGKVANGIMENGGWKDLSVWGVKSLTPYETLFNQDFNNDGFIGIDVSKLTAVSTDTKGLVLARDADLGLYMVDYSGAAPKATAVTNGGWLEYSNNWGSGSNKREAVAVEAMKDGSGFKLALKSTNKYDSNPEQVTWDILQLDTTGRVSYGSMVDGAWKDASIWGAKSIAPYEQLFGQDLNGDGSIGIDVSKLSAVNSDTSGIALMRDTEGGLYLVDGTGSAAVATVIGNAGWMEYSNSWGDGYNKREAVAVEAVKVGGSITGYKLAMKATNKWGGNEEQVTWDIIQLDATGKVTYGRMDSKTNMWVDETIYGAKSIASYEDLFGQDLNADGSIGIDIKTLTKVSTDTNGVGLRRDRDNALYLVDTVNGAEVARAVSSSWLEYSNNWGTGSNKREAVAIEANADGTGYRLAMKQTNNWNGTTDTTWEVLSLDATGRVSNSYAGSGYLSSRNVNLVEDIVNEDLNADGQVGVKLSDLQLVTTDEGKERLALNKTDKTLYILDGVTLDGTNITAANRKLAIVDSSGMTPQLETTFYTWNGTSAAKVYAVAKQDLGNGDYQYRVAVKVEKTTTGSTVIDTTWQIYTVSKDGVLDWTKVATSRNPDRFETLFNVDFNSDGKVSSALGVLDAVKTDLGAVMLKKDTFGTLYIVDSTPDAANGGITYLVDSKGGAPSFDKVVNGVTSSVYAVHKLDDGSYRLAVKKVSTVDGAENIQWEVHTLNKANANFEAAIDWAKVRYLSDVKDVEKLIQQDLDGDNLKGYASETPTTVNGDQGVVTAAMDSHGRLYINDASLTVSPLAVTDESGVQFVAERTQRTTESDSSVSGFTTEVLAAEAVTNGYKVMVKQTVSDTGKQDVVSYLIYSVSKEGVVNGNPVATPSPLRWESVFKQDFNSDASTAGVVQSKITASVNDTDLGADEFGAVYVKSGDVYIPVLSADGGNLAFTDMTALEGMSISSKPVAAQEQQNGDYLLAVEVDVTVGTETTVSWAVHTLELNEAGDAAQWQSAQYYDQATDLTDLFQQNVAVLGA